MSGYNRDEVYDQVGNPEHRFPEEPSLPESGPDKRILSEEERTEQLGKESHQFVTGELAGVPLVEITPYMIECAKVAMEQKLRGLEVPDDLQILAGVRIDDVGFISPIGSSQGPDHMTPAEQVGRRMAQTIPSEVVGTYNTNNGMLSYVDHLGRYYVAPSTEVLLDALNNAGYEHNGNMWVDGSNGEMPADEKRLEELLKARSLGRAVGSINALMGMGIDKTGEIPGILAGLSDNTTTEGSRIAEEVEYYIGLMDEGRNARERTRPKLTDYVPPMAEREAQIPATQDGQGEEELL